MSEFKTGDVAFVIHHENIISKIIAWFMKSKWSHSAVVYGSMGDKTFVCETSDFEVVINNLDRYLNDPRCSVEVYRKPLTLDDAVLIQKNSDQICGVIYGYLQLISLGIRRIFKLKIKNFFKQGLVCCHVISYAYDGIRGTGFENLEPESFDTEELYQIIKSSGWEMIHKKDGK
jgi:hypothetical protein